MIAVRREVVEGPGSGGYTLPRRGGRVVECGGLENRYVGNPGVGGSNPPLSALFSLSAGQHAPACGLRLSAHQFLVRGVSRSGKRNSVGAHALPAGRFIYLS